MLFRDASLADASSLAAISMEVWIGTYLRNGVSGFFADYALAEFTTANFEAIIASNAERIMVSQNEDGIDGFIRLSLESEAPVGDCSATEIKTLYVQPRHHGKGIGKGLLKEAIGRCAEMKLVSVWLTVNSQNTSALKFYAALDFRTVGQTHFRIADQAYLNEVLQYQIT